MYEYEYTCGICYGTKRDSSMPSGNCNACRATGWIIPRDDRERDSCEKAFNRGNINRRPIQR